VSAPNYFVVEGIGASVKSNRPEVSYEYDNDSPGNPVVEDPKTNADLDVLEGRVQFHSKDRDEVYREAIRLRPKRFATFYTGSMPKGTAIVL